MKKYISPNLEIMEFLDVADVLTLSNMNTEPSEDWENMVNPTEI